MQLNQRPPILPDPPPGSSLKAMLLPSLYARLTDARQLKPGQRGLAIATAKRIEAGQFDAADAALLPQLLRSF